MADYKQQQDQLSGCLKKCLDRLLANEMIILPFNTPTCMNIHLQLEAMLYSGFTTDC